MLSAWLLRVDYDEAALIRNCSWIQIVASSPKSVGCLYSYFLFTAHFARNYNMPCLSGMPLLKFMSWYCCSFLYPPVFAHPFWWRAKLFLPTEHTEKSFYGFVGLRPTTPEIRLFSVPFRVLPWAIAFPSFWAPLGGNCFHLLLFMTLPSGIFHGLHGDTILYLKQPVFTHTFWWRSIK